jgi:hypothetical protein
VGRSSSLVRTLALRAKGRRFKSGPAHQPQLLPVQSELSSELTFENCVIRLFKWFSKVLLKFMPRPRDFSTNSLSKYNTTFLLVVIAFAPSGCAGTFFVISLVLSEWRIMREVRCLQVLFHMTVFFKWKIVSNWLKRWKENTSSDAQ